MHKLTPTLVATFAMLALTAVDASAQRLSAAGKCQAAKNQEAGKYAACLHKAEARLINAKGQCSISSETRCFRDNDCQLAETCVKDTTKVDDAVFKCGDKFAAKWGKLEAAAVKKGDVCPDGLLATEVQDAVDEHIANVAAGLAGEGLVECADAADLTACNDDLTQAQDDFTTCSADLGTCQAGTAVAADVVSGKTFSSGAGLAVSGTMPNQGAVNLTPGAAPVSIAQGYHDGSGTVAGDANLASGNIRSGVTIFGVSGSSTVVNTSGATAVAGDILTGKTAYVNGSLVTGNVAAGANVSGANAQKTFTIPNGLYTGSKTATANDSNLVAGNIRSGVSIFGVAGSSTVVNTSGATAVAGDILTGKTAYVNGSLVTGNVAAGANVSGANGSKTFTIPNGVYTGSKTATANDSNLIASNILSGVTIFGVTGSSSLAQRLKTGQTQCWDASNTLVSCTGTGQDGELQKGLTVSYTTNANGTITDNRTGLVWERLNDAGGINDKDAEFTWTSAFNKIKVLNGDATGCIAAGNPSSCCTGAGTGSGCTAFAGFTDWRLPNVNELQSLVNYGTSSPATHAAFNSSCTTNCTTCSCTRSYYWSATSRQLNPIGAFRVDFQSGTVGNTFDKTGDYHVRAVRGGT